MPPTHLTNGGTYGPRRAVNADVEVAVRAQPGSNERGKVGGTDPIRRVLTLAFQSRASSIHSQVMHLQHISCLLPSKIFHLKTVERSFTTIQNYHSP